MVHVCTVTPISMTVGANRIVPAIAIPHPLGNPALTPEEEYNLRKKIVNRALEALTTEVKDQTIFVVLSKTESGHLNRTHVRGPVTGPRAEK